MSNHQHPPLQLSVERFIAATPARLYRALTDATELEQWFFSDIATDPRPGGHYRGRWRSKSNPAEVRNHSGRYLELVPDHKIVFEWNADGSGASDSKDVVTTIVTITLTPEGAGTRVRLTQTGWPDSASGHESRDGHDSGWTFYLENLSNFATGAPDLRESRLGQAVKKPC